MVKKSQLKRYTVEKIMELAASETDGEILKMYNQVLIEKNTTLINQRNDLIQQLDRLRTQIQKVFREMNEGVKDRIKLKSKTIMDKQSRPTREELKEMAELFAYIEHQHSLMQRNSSDISFQGKKLAQKIQELKPKLDVRADPSDLDQQYIQLNEQCAREEEVRDQLIREREGKLKHYGSIGSSIDQYRVEYQLVEERIREKERELIHLTTYFEARKQEDRQLLNELRVKNMSLENELLKAQEILNNNTTRCEGLMIKGIQVLSHTP